jgi:hypothetical protein
MFKSTVMTVTFSLFVLVGIAAAEVDDRDNIVRLDENTFVIVNYKDQKSDGADAVLSLFKVRKDQLMLLDEVHYKAAQRLSMRTSSNQSYIKRIKTQNE